MKNLPGFWVENWKNRSAYRWRNMVCFFVKWQILLRVTFQAYKSSTFPRQHHTLTSSTVWILSLVVCWRTHWKTRPLQRKIPKNITEAERSLSSVAIIWVHVPLRSIKCWKFDTVAHVVLFLDQVTTGYPGLMQMHADHFSADLFWLYEFVRLRTKGLSLKTKLM